MSQFSSPSRNSLGAAEDEPDEAVELLRERPRLGREELGARPRVRERRGELVGRDAGAVPRHMGAPPREQRQLLWTSDQ